MSDKGFTRRERMGLIAALIILLLILAATVAKEHYDSRSEKPVVSEEIFGTTADSLAAESKPSENNLKNNNIKRTRRATAKRDSGTMREFDIDPI